MSAIPQPWRDIMSEIAKIKEQLRRLSNASPFFGTPIRPKADGSIQSDDFDGDLATDNAGTKGWALSSLKAAFGELILRPGSIGNDSLTNPVIPGVVNLRVTNFSLSTGPYVEIAGADLTVPDGFTKLSFTGTSMMNALNPRTSGGSDGTGSDWLYTRVGIGSTFSPSTTATGVSGSGGSATATNTYAQVLTGLTPGATVRASAFGVCDYGIPASTLNEVLLSASLTWWR